MSDYKHGILDKTLDELLQNNSQAQNIVMKAMNITPEQLQQMLQTAQSNQLMHMTVRDLFKNGIVQQAIQTTNKAPEKQSFLQKLKSFIL